MPHWKHMLRIFNEFADVAGIRVVKKNERAADIKKVDELFCRFFLGVLQTKIAKHMATNDKLILHFRIELHVLYFFIPKLARLLKKTHSRIGIYNMNPLPLLYFKGNIAVAAADIKHEIAGL